MRYMYKICNRSYTYPNTMKHLHTHYNVIKHETSAQGLQHPPSRERQHTVLAAVAEAPSAPLIRDSLASIRAPQPSSAASTERKQHSTIPVQSLKTINTVVTLLLPQPPLEWLLPSPVLFNYLPLS